jgi:hypothetical protein
VAIGFVLGLLLGSQAKAEPQNQVDLRWEAPQGCPQVSEVRGRIQKILGSGRHDSPLRAEGTITRMDTHYRLELVVHVGEVTGTRRLTSRSCDDLAGAAAVELALLVHSVESTAAPNRTDTEPLATPPVTGVEASPSTSIATDAPTAPSVSPPSPDARPPVVARSEPKKEIEQEATRPAPEIGEPRRWRVLVQAPGLVLGIGPLPPLAVGLGIALGLEYDRWQLQLNGRMWRRQNVPASGLPGYGVDVDRMGASFWVCRESRFAWLGLSPCFATGTERISASGTGVSLVSTPRHALGVSLGAGVQGRIHLASSIRLLAVVAGEVELLRPELAFDRPWLLAPPSDAEQPKPPPPIYRFAPAALTATLSLEWAL